MPGILSLDSDWGGGSLGGGGGSTGGGGSLGGSNGSSYADPTVAETGTLQILLSEGTVEGLVDGLKSVYLDGTPIENADGTHNFKGIALALVAGTNTQASVKGITGTESETAVGVQVIQATPVVRTISTNPSAVRVRISIPALKVVSTTDGKSSGNTVTVKIERKHATYTSGAWQVVTLQGGGVIYGGPFSTKYTRSYRIDTPAAGAWDIRVTRVSADDADAYHQSQTWWEAYTEIVDARLRYPNSSVLSLRVNAKQFRSIPQVNVLMKGVKVDVPANYDPVTRVYATTGAGTSGGAWDGTFKTAWTDNPAWTFYAAAVKTRYGAGTFLSASGMDKWTLYQIAQWADTLVDDGHGGTEPRMTCNMYIQAPQNAIKALGQLASIFWGVIYYASGLVIPVPDSDDAPVAMFTNANVEGGKFSYEGTARQARHTAAIVKFNNPDLAYSSDAAVYEDEAGIARYGYNPLDIQGIGCTSQGQTLRLAKWAILSELMAPEIVAFSSGLEGSTVKPGDVVQVADQFRAGNARAGGRIIGTATTTVIPLDASVTLAAGTYTLRCQTGAGMESRTVTTGAGTVSSLTVSPAYSVAPAEGAGWLLQKNSEASLWRLLSVKKGDGLKHDLIALKHDPAKYTALGLTAGDVITRVPLTLTAVPPAGLAVTSTTRILKDRQRVTLNANWTLDGALGYVAEASRDYGPWEPMVISGASAYLDGIQLGSWRVRVAGDWRYAGRSPYSQTTFSPVEVMTQPDWVAAAQSTANTALTDAATANNAATYADALARSSNNLIKNGNSEDSSATGPEANGRTYDPTESFTGNYCRELSSVTALRVTNEIQSDPGDQFVFLAKHKTFSSAPGRIFIRHQLASSAAFDIATGDYSSSWTDISVSGVAPAGTVSTSFWIESTDANGRKFFDNLYACRKISAGMLEADIALLGVIRSPNYVAGTSSAGPVGFKQSGFAFPTTYIGGATDANCHMELEGTANFGGYRVATVNDRLFTACNRILNGTFYKGYAHWGLDGPDLPVTTSDSATAGSLSVIQRAVAPAGGSTTKTGSIFQAFVAPPLRPGQVVNVECKTAIQSTGVSTDRHSGYVSAYLFNPLTNTETLLATWSYALTAGTQSYTWTSRSVVATSLLTSGGDFVIRFELQAFQEELTGVTGVRDCRVAIDEIKIII